MEMMKSNNPIWIDTRLSEEEMIFLRRAISTEEKMSDPDKIYMLVDKDNWFYEMTLKKLTERMFYQDWDNYYKYVIEKEESPPEFELSSFWVNHMKQYEFNPFHNHHGLFSFVIFVKIPTHWKEQHALPIFGSLRGASPVASNFEFLLGHGKPEETISILLSPEDEGRMLFFPAWLKHQVYPFYGTEEYRITISGNIDFLPEKVSSEEEIRGTVIKKEQEVEKQITFYEEQLKFLREQLKKAKG